MKKITGLLLVAVLVIVTMQFSQVSAETGSVTENPTCDNPTVEIKVAAQTGLSFNLSTITVPKNTCVKLTLENTDTMFHDLDVEAKGALKGVEIEVDAGKTASITFMTPDADIETEFFCTVPGHKAAGMFGTFIVGNGNAGNADSTSESSAGFGLASAFLALFAIFAIPALRRK